MKKSKEKLTNFIKTSYPFDQHTRILFMVLCFMIVPVFLMALFSTQYLETKLQEKQDRYLKVNLEVAASEMQQRQKNIQQIAFCIGQDRDTQKAILHNNVSVLQDKMTLLRSTFNKIDYAVIVNSKNELLAKSSDDICFSENSKPGRLSNMVIKHKMPITSSETIPLDNLFTVGSKDYDKFVINIQKNKNIEKNSMLLALCETTIVPILDRENNHVMGNIILIGISNSGYYFPSYIRSKATDGFLVLTVDGVRVATESTKGEDRSWLIGTKSEMTSEQRSDGNYYGKINLEGEEYLFMDMPVKDYKGNIVGYISFGLPESHFSDIVDDNRKLSLFIGFLCFMVFAPLAQVASAQLRQNKQDLEKTIQLRTADLQTTLEEMKRLDSTKTAFMSNITHELRTPLCVIINACDFLKGRYCGDLNEKQYKYVNSASECGTHLLSLINDLLDLNKINSGKKTVHYMPFSIKDILFSTIEEMKSFNPDRNVTIESEIVPEDFVMIADSKMIKEIFYNLLSNAIKFSRQNGKVTVKIFRRDNQMEAIVEDKGIGIPEEFQDIIFNEFEQVDNKLSKKYSGTGLGLPIVKKLVELHNGKIYLRSSPGKGTRIIFTLPLRPPEQENNEKTYGKD